MPNDYINKYRINNILYDFRDENVRAAVAHDFTDLTFPVPAGSFCWHDGILFRAKYDIQSSEDWTSDHWELDVFGDIMQGVNGTLNDVLIKAEFNPTSNGGNTFSYQIVAGKWYRIRNYSSSQKMAVSIRNNSEAVQHCGVLAENQTIFFRANNNGDTIYLYTFSADENARIDISSGDAIDPQSMDGCFGKVLYAPDNGRQRYKYPIVKGKIYKVVNNGSKETYVRTGLNGTLKDNFGALPAGGTMYIVPSVDCDEIDFYKAEFDATGEMLIFEGEIIDAQFKAQQDENAIAMIQSKQKTIISIAGLTWTSGYIGINEREWRFNSGYRVSQFLPCWQEDSIIVNGKTTLTNNCSVISFFDENGKCVDVKNNLGTDFTDISVIVPAHACFFRISAPAENADQTSIAYNGAKKTPLYKIRSDMLSQSKEIKRIKDAMDGGFVLYDQPNGFTWTDHPVSGKIYTDGKGSFRVDYNVLEHVSTSGIDVYVAANGDDTNDGLSPLTPKKSISSAFGVTDARRIHVSGGYYPRLYLSATHDIDIIGDPDNRPVFTSQVNTVAWTATATTGVYTTSHGNNCAPYDLTTMENGFYRAYALEDSVADVQSNPGTYYDDGSTVYLHTFDDGEPTLDKVCYTPKFYTCKIETSGKQILLANLRFVCGGTYSGLGQVELTGNETNRGTFLLYNCDSSHSFAPDSTNVSGGSCFKPLNADCVFQHCTSYYSGNDGFSYGAGCKVVEIDCASAFNGANTTITSCNGSTAHGGSIIRINGAYHDTHGPIVHDVGATQSINLGLAAWHSTCEGKPNFCASGGYVKMWLDSCVSYSSDAGIDVGKPDESAPNATIYKRNCSSDVSDREYGGHIYRY